MGTSRFVYNQTVEHLKQPDTTANWIDIKKWLLPDLPVWAKPVPYQIKGIAIRDACLAVKKAKQDFTEKGQYQQVSFRSRKNPKQSLFLPSSALKEDGFYKTIIGKVKFTERIEAEHDCRLLYQQGRWFVCVPTKTERHEAENQGRMIALDPGVRTFQTAYSADFCGKIGEGDFQRIYRLCLNLDDLLSRMTQVKARARSRMKKASDRLRWKIKDLISELHHKTALFLVRNFDLIVLPVFETSQMSQKSSRKIRRKTVRSMLSFAHYRFQQFLIHKAQEYGKLVVLINEAYTSKTCSWNGVIKQIGGSKIIRDNGIVLDRDYNGARGIMLRALVDSPSLIGCGRAFVDAC